MEYRKTESVRQSGYISFKIQIKKWIFWFDYQLFSSRQSRDIYFDKLQNN